MSSPAKYLLAVLAIMAVGTSQVLGLARGFICLCTGEAVAVAAPDCDAAGCHQQEGHDHGETDSKDHEHSKLTQPLLGRAFVPLVLDLPPLAESGVPPAHEWTPRPLAKQLPAVSAHEPSGCGPPASVLVARTVVLRV